MIITLAQVGLVYYQNYFDARSKMSVEPNDRTRRIKLPQVEQPIKERSFFRVQKRGVSLLVVLCWMIFAAASFYYSATASTRTNAENGFNSQTGESDSAATDIDENGNDLANAPDADIELTESAAIQDFSRFSHTNRAHASVSCLLCHRRDDNSARPKRPGHTPCIGCHTEQFQDSNSQICVICHTNPGASNPGTRAFPPLRSFTVRFSHAVHNRRGAAPRESCATCHRPAQRGVARSIPAGLNAHETCFQCHTNRAQAGGRDISSCATCHTLGRFSRASESARAFRLNFSHDGHRALNCNECHQVKAGYARGKQVTATTPAMHFPPARAQSCATCHNNKRAFGGEDFSDCKRCHEGNSFRF